MDASAALHPIQPQAQGALALRDLATGERLGRSHGFLSPTLKVALRKRRVTL